MDNNIKVFAVVVTYNGRPWIDKCLKSLEKSSTPVNIIVIDNGSQDGTQEIIKGHPQVEFIQAAENLGFGKANNRGIAIALGKKADYVFLLNQDAWIETNTITALSEIAGRNPGYGVVSPIHLNGACTGLDLNFSRQLAPDTCPSFYSDLYVRNPRPLYEITFVGAAAWLISASCLGKVGLFEPMFFLYGEDNNFLQRVKYHGFKIGVTPLCAICHDRESRRGNLNEQGAKIWERTSSLIMLLNILDSYSRSILLFLRERLLLMLKYTYQRRFLALKCPIGEIIFLVTHFNAIRRVRNYHKSAYVPGAQNLSA